MQTIEMQQPIFNQNPIRNVPQPKKSDKPTRSSVIKTKHDQQWQEFYDANSGKNYYYNKTTGITQWEKPSGVVFH